MKKLALIVILAVIASRALTHRDHHRPHHPRPTWAALTGDDGPPLPPPPPAPPGPGRMISWGDDDGGEAAAPPPARAAKGRRRVTAGRAFTTTITTTTTARVMPPWFPKSDEQEQALARPDARGVRVLVGQLSASPERARLDLRKRVDREVAAWLAADIPPSWTPPRRLVDAMIGETYVEPVVRSFAPTPGEAVGAANAAAAEPLAGLDELYTLYRAGQRLDFADARRSEFVEAYRRDVASARMRRSGSVIAVVLSLLAITTLYLRADEATKGYYTNRLRVLATLGLGAAGIVAYRYWA